MAVLKRIRLLIVVLVVAALVAVAMWPEAVTVDVATATTAPMHVSIDEDGVTRVRHRFVISAPVAGRVERIDLEPGDRVTRQATVLARLAPLQSSLLDPRTRAELNAAVDAARAAVGQAQAELQRATAALDRARSSEARQRALFEAGAIPRDTLEAAQTGVQTAEEAARAASFAVQGAEYQLQLARARLQAPQSSGAAIDLRAPIDGTVLRRYRESAAVVAPGEPLLEIGDPTQIEIVADLLSTDAVRVPRGAEVLIEQWGGGHTLRGRVRRVEPAGFMKVSALGVEEQRVNVIIDFEDPTAAGRALGDGYRVEVRIVIWSEANALTVSAGSLFRQDEGWAVFAVEGGVARLRPVQLGRRNQSVGQILGGLSAGETVVLHPPDTLTDGTRVTVRGT
ncbi:MAG TPA: efflux RND transporter periplasmic adaptor subunit [Vicinamibacterales bacterium]|nr:efflux RND transporter periplasmic adaptor subunit [Vicinamibacterales bacterium]